MSKLTDDFKTAIEAKIVQLEKSTSVEFVPVIIARCSKYLAFRGFFTLLAFLLSLALLLVFESWMLPRTQLVIATAFALFTFLSTFTPLLKFLLPESVKRKAVENEAFRQFVLQEVFLTRARTGVLIFISEFEHATYVLADRGVSKVIPDAQWAELGQKLAKDFSKHKAGETFLKALDQITAQLAGHFPPAASNENELVDSVREI